MLGDKTTHGGEVITASATARYMGKPMARVGDQVSCPKCGTNVIVEGCATAFDHGNKIAVHDCATACGARLIANSSGQSTAAESNAETTDNRTLLEKAKNLFFPFSVKGKAYECQQMSLRIQMIPNLSAFAHGYIEMEKLFGAGTKQNFNDIPLPQMHDELFEKYLERKEEGKTEYQELIAKYLKECR